MPIEQILEIEAIKSNPGLVQELKDAFDKASALETVKKANADITAERETLKNEKKDLAAKLEDAKKGGGATPELRALQEQLADLTQKWNQAEEKATKAERANKAAELKSSVVSAASSAISPNQVFALMQTEGLVGHGEEGKPFYHRINEKGEPVAAKPDEAVAAFLKSNPHLEKASGSQGSGKQPNTNGTTQTGLLKDPMAYLK
jgi:peptidoglycan hydrolase-like protein with peptidoglycan-binding domain